jgi:hypothetical protein
VIFKTDFTSGGPVNTHWDTTSGLQFRFSHANICNGTGDVILVTDGSDIYGANKTLIDNGDSIVSDVAYDLLKYNLGTQNSIILPLGDSIYYVFNGTFSDTTAFYVNEGNNLSYPGCDQLRYHLVDMKLNNYQGKVVKKNRLAMDSVFTSSAQMTAVRHANGHDWWLVRNGIDLDSDSSELYTFWVTQDSVYGPYIQVFQHPATGSHNISPYGQASFSNDGSVYANVALGLNNFISITKFDRCGGIFSDNQRTWMPSLVLQNTSSAIDTLPASLCFSPNDAFLYVNTRTDIYQWELNDPNPATAWVHIAGIDTAWQNFQLYTSLYVGHDGKVYIGNIDGFSSSMSVINSPDQKGALADFCPKCLDFPPVNSFLVPYGRVASPPNMPNYTLGSDPNCFTTIPQQQERREAFTLYPNPADATLTVQSATGGSFQLVDMLGRVVLYTSLSPAQPGKTTSTANLPAGIYTYRYTSGNTQATTGKLVIQH